MDGEQTGNDPARMEEPTALSDRGWVHFMAEDLAAALADLTAAQQLDPSNAEVYCRRGAVYLTLGDLEAAIADLTEAATSRLRASLRLRLAR